MTDESGSNVDGSEEDAAERQQRLGKNIVRLTTVLAIPYVIIGLWALPVEVLTVLFFLSVALFMVGIPLLIKKDKVRLLMLLLVPVVIALVDLFPEMILGPIYVFVIITVPIGGPLLLGMIVLYLHRRSQLGRGVEDTAVDDSTL